MEQKPNRSNSVKKSQQKGKSNKDQTTKKPNILLIMADEFRFPRYDDAHGMDPAIKNILGFQGNENEDIQAYKRFFPGLVRLRENATVLRNHTIASSACIPSRAALFTGQYGTRTNVTQTDGVFKDGASEEFNWLEADGIPTMGDWFKTIGYDTYYFGKCHFADPDDQSLEDWGFDGWESSYPEPHGTSRNNLGYYRDFGFADIVTNFLHGKGLGLDYNRKEAKLHEVIADHNAEPAKNKGGKSSQSDAVGQAIADAPPKPWFAVASFTNPHDITTWPLLPLQVQTPPDEMPDNALDLSGPLLIPEKDSRSNPPEKGTWRLELNPKGFPQDNASLPPTWDEVLTDNNKPDCQYDYSIKLGMALAAKSGKLIPAEVAGGAFGIPLQLAPKPDEWSNAYLQYYTYLHHFLDQHIDRVLKALDESGQRENTIVVFAPDHGEYGASHGMLLQKWHTAYQEAIQVPVVIAMPPGLEENEGIAKQIDALTSHIDLLPTLLGLAGVSEGDRGDLAAEIRAQNHVVPDLVGADLSNLVESSDTEIQEPGGRGPRQGVLFVTTDKITEPFDLSEENDDFEHYKTSVDLYRSIHNDQNIHNGPVMQPCEVTCVRQEDWKLVRYSDPGDAQNLQWELYNLTEDHNEEYNLLTYNSVDFLAHTDNPLGFTAEVIEAKAADLSTLMTDLEGELLSPVPAGA